MSGQLQLAAGLLTEPVAPALRRDRQRALAGELAGQAARAADPGAEAGAAVRLVRDPDGRPRLAPPWQRLSVSIAHSGQLVLAGCAPVPFGLDCEQDRQISEVEQLATLVLPAATAAAVRAVPSERRSQEFLRHWTRLEAISKASGVPVTRLLRTELDPRWHCYQVQVRAGYLVAVAAAEPVAVIQHRPIRKGPDRLDAH